MKVPEDKIQQVRDATDIVELVSQYVTLKKRGRSYLGLCPFHQEKTPSFNVDPARQFFHCFGCGEGGNAFTFLMKMERISFPEALRQLADKAGIALPQYEPDLEQDREVENLYLANRIASEFFRDCFLKTQGGEKARRYLEGRKFDAAIAEQFLIGYAPNLWDGLIQKAKRESLPLDLLEKAGLIVSRQNRSGYYDRFRGRLMFPIQNASGRVIGFGGRALTEGPNTPKYLNSPETPIYQKSHVLYGLFQSKDGIRKKDRLLIVEGYMDLMRLVTSGFDNAVATSGTALTEGHARLIARYTKEVTLIFDGDAAGFSAAAKGLQILLANGLHVGVAAMPKGHDPDSLIRDKGADAMNAVLDRSRDVVDYLISQVPGLGNKSPSERAKAAHEILQTLVQVKDPVERNLMVKATGEKLGIDEQVLYQQVRRLSSPESSSQSPQKIQPTSASIEAERAILRLLLEEPMKWTSPILDVLGVEHFEGVLSRQLFDFFQRNFQEHREIGREDLVRESGTDPDMAKMFSDLMSEEIDPETDRSQLAIDCILSLRLKSVRAEIREKQRLIKRKQDAGEDVTEITREWIHLKKSLENQRAEIVNRWKKNIEFIL